MNRLLRQMLLLKEWEEAFPLLMMGHSESIGLDIEARAQLTEWLFADADVNIARGRFRDLPEGENYIPLAPSLTSTAGVTFRFQEGYEGSIRVRHIGDRPANEDNSVRAEGNTVFDASVGYRFGSYRLQLSAENIFNVEWNEAQFDTESRLLNETDAVSELHFTPGTPLSVKMKAEFSF
ncbi:MAG: TonB-dependent receptor domain-containing protein [Bacteroidota bacterium]